LTVLALFATKWIRAAKKEMGKALFIGNRLSPIYVVYTLFLSNFIGIAFARTLHYQFYSWYFHALPLLLWLTKMPMMLRVIIVFMVEFAFNVFPATALSSAVIQLAHVITLFALWRADVPQILRQQQHVKEL